MLNIWAPEREGISEKSLFAAKEASRYTADIKSEDVKNTDPAIFRKGYPVIDYWRASRRSSVGRFSSRDTTGDIVTEIDALSKTSRTADLSWLDEVNETIEKLTLLDADWNGRGAQSVDEVEAVEAKRILAIASEKGTTKPFVAPSPGGGFFIKFASESRHLSIMVEKRVAYAQFSVDDNVAPFGGNLSGYASQVFYDHLRLAFEHLLVSNGDMAA